MEYLVTTCCKEKRTDPGELPAIERYLSDRIRHLHIQSLQTGKPMLIFSGKYGLLSPEEPIPWYDQKLERDAVDEIVPVLATQLLTHSVRRVTFVCHPRHEPGWLPYHEALEQACKLAGVEISIRLTKRE